MDYLDAKKLYRGIIIALISTVVPLVLLGSVQLIFGVKVSKDNAKAIQKIQDNYMRTDLFERWVVLLEERTARNTKHNESSTKAINELDDKIDDLYDQLKVKAYGKSRGSNIDTTNITFNGIY